jgi:hypothetical protein
MWRAAIARGLALALVGVRAGSEEPEPLEVRGVGGLPDATLIDLAKAAQPIWLAGPDGGTTLAAMLRAHCGDVSERVAYVLGSLTLRWNAASSLDERVAPDTAVALPFCLNVKENVPVTVQPGDTLESLLLTNYGLSGPKTRQMALALNDVEGRWSSPEEFSRSLREHQTILIPFSSEPRVFEPAAELAAVTNDSVTTTAALLRDTVARTNATGTATAFVANTAPARPPALRSSPKFHYVRFVTATQSHGCRQPPSSEPPFPVALLKARLEAEATAAKAFLGRSLWPIVVGVIDSGINDLGVGVFSERTLEPNPFERAEDGADNDVPKNSYVDDLYGINFNGQPQNGSIHYYDTDNEDAQPQHGTRVGTLVVGGKAWLDAVTAYDPLPARLKIVNFARIEDGLPVDAANLGPAITYLLHHQAKVINMSLASEQAVQALDGNSSTLFVVAAGNNDAGGRDLKGEDVWPAKSGGRKLGNVLTVGSHNDGDGRGWARFSNYSETYVDLLAPGCSVPTLDVTGKQVRENGTSISTALVTFAASLVASLGEIDPRNVKNRLLVSVDVDRALTSRSWSSGRLNMVKAISLSNDVIERLDDAPYEFGHLEHAVGDLAKFCDDAVVQGRLQTRSIMKVRPNLGAIGAPRIEYWYLSGAELERDECPQKKDLSSERIAYLDGNGVAQAGPQLAEIKDLVLASRR